MQVQEIEIGWAFSKYVRPEGTGTVQCGIIEIPSFSFRYLDFDFPSSKSKHWFSLFLPSFSFRWKMKILKIIFMASTSDNGWGRNWEMTNVIRFISQTVSAYHFMFGSTNAIRKLLNLPFRCNRFGLSNFNSYRENTRITTKQKSAFIKTFRISEWTSSLSWMSITDRFV